MDFTYSDLEKVQEQLEKEDNEITEPLTLTDNFSEEKTEKLQQINEQLQNGELLIATDEPTMPMPMIPIFPYFGGQSLESVIEPIIKVKYHDPEMPRIERLQQGDWIDLVNVEDINLKCGEWGMFSLGVSIELPAGYEAHVVPRSSTFKKWGVIQVNSIGIVDNSFCGEDDVWQWLILAPTKDVHIPKYTRVCQFRIIKNQPSFPIIEVKHLKNDIRGGIGSTGE